MTHYSAYIGVNFWLCNVDTPVNLINVIHKIWKDEGASMYNPLKIVYVTRMYAPGKMFNYCVFSWTRNY